MKNRVEIYILLGLIAIFSLYIILRKDQNINYQTPKLEDVKQGEVTKVTFNNLSIQKDGDNWYLPSGYKVDENSLKRVTNEVANIKIIDKISESDDLKRFGLETPLKLEVFKNQKSVIKLDIGSTSSTGNYT
ncbi:hypothetical protein EW093_08185 [Thiospirochaeta perfilievii]|uniref:DUF4340 domain-containing protein n=1 Tax=Thiospirochaeta perfilievii TaxID=252967 RepID=A0A5C1QD92_9SPIO|nr:hypothetical protein [Thiospirochaeta perfilievii]QEN04684.1 hypothetical protein EW093_08185 [Thiospirochaeta perfilievii]